LQALAEALSAAYEQSSGGPAAPRRVRDEELYAAGARYPAMLRSLAWRFTDHEPREDAFALDVLVTAVESEGVLDRSATRDVLRHLAAALRLDVEEAPDRVEARVALLERLHRVRPGLAFPRLYLGREALAAGDPKRALAFLTTLAGPLSESAHVLMLRGACAESLGDPDRALELYRLAHARAPQIPDVHYRIGRILIRRAAREAERAAETRAEEAPPMATQSGESASV
jgi:tetratricopeptide (TPR) repeat protein